VTLRASVVFGGVRARGPYVSVILGSRTLGIALVALACSVACPQPKVTSTDPVNGAAGVQGPELSIEVKFSEPMKTSSWSLVAAGETPVPEVLGDPAFGDPQTCRISVRVAPGHEYALGLNSETRRGFVSADGQRALEPFVLRFTTAAEQQDDSSLVVPEANWRQGETQERILTTETQTSYTILPDTEGSAHEKVVSTFAFQVPDVRDARYRAVRGKVVKLEVFDGEGGGELQGGPEQVPDGVLEAALEGGKWTLKQQADGLPAEALARFRAMVTRNCPFAPRGPVAVGDRWILDRASMDALGGMLASDGPVQGTVRCTLKGLGEIKGHPIAKIEHAWDVKFAKEGVAVTGTGNGTTTFLTDARKYISSTVNLKIVAPRQRMDNGASIEGKGTHSAVLRLRYFPAGEYPELAATRGPSPASRGMFAHPRGLYRVKYTESWQPEFDAERGCLQLRAPSGKGLVWIWESPAQGAGLQSFYDQVFATPLRQEWGNEVQIEEPHSTTDADGEWLVGKAAAKGAFVQSCSAIRSGDSFLAIILNAMSGITGDEFKQLNAVRDGFRPAGGATRPNGAQGRSQVGPKAVTPGQASPAAAISQGSPATSSSVVGTWVYSSAGAELAITFDRDGAYSTGPKDPKYRGQGRYTVQDGVLELRPDKLQQARKYECRALGADTLLLKDQVGRITRLKRQ